MKAYLYPYNIGSKSARALARALHSICVRENGTYVPRSDHILINWGNPRQPRWGKPSQIHSKQFLNHWDQLPATQNKRDTFRVWQKAGIPTPEWTADRKEAEKWIREEGVVVVRTLLNGHSGNGIVIAETVAQLGQAPLYTLYKRKKKEFRVHVFMGKVIDIQQKRLANGAKEEENYNQYIRSHANGWIFARENISEPKDLRSLAVKAVSALGLDFGAVDIIYNEKENKCYCLEVNSAPGLEGQTLVSYTNAIKEYINVSGKGTEQSSAKVQPNHASPTRRVLLRKKGR